MSNSIMSEETKKVKAEKVQAVIVKSQDETSMDNLLKIATDKGSVEVLERLLIMRKSLREEYAKTEFDKAMSEFQGKCPIIEKTKLAHGYYYAPLEVIVEQTKSLMQKCGLSYNFKTEMKPSSVSVVCFVNHIAGYTKSSDPVELPVTNIATREGKQVMSAPQAVGSTITYAKRYAFVNVFGIMSGDEDTDARKEREEEEQKSAVENEVKIAIAKIQGAMNLNALKGVFISLPPLVQNNEEVVKAKDEKKLALTPVEEVEAKETK